MSIADERLDIVDAFVNDSSIRTFIAQDFLGRVPDFERLVRKFIRKKANLEVRHDTLSPPTEFVWLGLLQNLRGSEQNAQINRMHRSVHRLEERRPRSFDRRTDSSKTRRTRPS